MKFPKVGEYRIKASIDFEGDYVVNVQLYRGFFSGWRNQKAYYAVGFRTTEECVRLARDYIKRAEPVQLGVIK